MRLIATAVALAALTAAILVYVNVDPAAAKPSFAMQGSAAGDCPQCKQLSEAVEGLHRDVIAMKSELASQRSQSGARPVIPGADSKPVQSTDDVNDADALRAAEAERHRVYMAGIAQAFTNERVDVAWASRTSSRVGAALDAEQTLRGAARNVDCRQQTCRVEIDDDGSGQLNRRLPMITLGLADVLPTTAAQRVDRGNGRSAMILYMSSQAPTPPPGQPRR